MNNTWTILKKVCEVKRGERITTKLLINNGYPVMSGGISNMGYYDKYNRNENTITIAQYGTAGFVNWISEKFWANDVCYCLFPDNSKIMNKFLYYFLKSKQQYIYNDVIKANPPYYPLNNLESFPIPIIEMETQQHIVNIIGSVDDLIENINNINKKLDEYLELKFCNLKPSNLSLKDVCNIKHGRMFTLSKLNHNLKYPVYGSSGIVGTLDSYMFAESKIKISRVGKAGDVALTSSFCNISDNSLYLNLKNYKFTLPLFYYLRNKIKNYSTGSVQPLITSKNISTIKIPDFNKLSFDSTKYINFINANNKKIKYLNKIKEFLLNKYF